MLDRRIEENKGVYSHEFYLAAGECNAESLMPLPYLVNRLIRVATEHANLHNVGYARFAPLERGWVLLTLTLEMRRYPRIGDKYTIKTWLESVNKLMTYRNFAIYCNDEIVGYVRTVWAIIDMNTRKMCDITVLDDLMATVRPDVPCPIKPQAKIRPIKQGRVSHYTFGYCDVDFNRHVNTVRYIERIINQWPLEHFDRHMVSRFEIVFIKECYYGTTVAMTTDDSNAMECLTEISNGELTHCRARLKFSELNTID